MTVDVTICEVDFNGAHGRLRQVADIQKVAIFPRSNAKPQPAYIPEAIREDYAEACLIRDDSPKASATLSRRALQGMIRDFCGIEKRTLFAEIEELKRLVDIGEAPKGVQEETITAIHAVRELGNIGAHMEADISLIVEVEADEAQALIDLIEMLFEEWYVARDSREQKLARLLKINAEKQAVRKPAQTAIPE